MNILLAGQKWFGAEVYKTLKEIKGIKVSHISAPIQYDKADRLQFHANQDGVPIIPAGTLNKYTMPDGIDLIVTAHSHDFIGEATRLRARFGGIGYHPSLLPLHRGRDSVEWTIRMGDKVTGGTVYRLSNKTDGGNIIKQEHVFVEKGDTARNLWEEKLGPMGVRLLAESVRQFRDGGFINGTPQNEKIATWEPSITREALYKPDLILLPAYCLG
ncbi:MAG: formyltransferase family protein [Thiomicrospira sp.]|jgi:methionyl-tRNA formyltransferase|nr:formyltransferase family protein [Thiomicrospira sp.]